MQEIRKMEFPNAKAAGQVVAGGLVGVALDKGAEWVDDNVDLFKSQPEYFKAQFLVDSVGGALLLLSGITARPRALRPASLACIAAGSVLLIKFALDHIPRLSAPTATAKFVAAPAPAQTATAAESNIFN